MGKGLLKDRTVLVKRSKSDRFRYIDMKKNAGAYKVESPIEESQMTFGDFLDETQKLLAEGSPQRMYLQETLSGHDEMAQEFVSWRWEFLIRVSTGCGWGLPDTNELFIGMPGAQTLLHFDERENMFFQVKGRKEVVVWPFIDYLKCYPFPTTHPCDRQSMVGDPRAYDGEAFPNFAAAVGHHTVLKANDLLYLPYGWWHWLRNLDHLSTSVSFWCTTPSTDLSRGVPDSLSQHMLTRVRRNLENMVAGMGGADKHAETMLKLKGAVESNDEKDALLIQVRGLLSAVKVPKEEQGAWLLEQIDGRYDIDWNKYL